MYNTSIMGLNICIYYYTYLYFSSNIFLIIFITVVKEALVKTGALSEIQARIRSEVFHVLQEDTEPPPPLSKENILINELIREYLIYNGYFYAESVLIAGNNFFK